MARRFYDKQAHEVITAQGPIDIAIAEAGARAGLYVDLARLRRQVEARLRLDDLLVLDLGLKLGLITQD